MEATRGSDGPPAGAPSQAELQLGAQELMRVVRAEVRRELEAEAAAKTSRHSAVLLAVGCCALVAMQLGVRGGSPAARP